MSYEQFLGLFYEKIPQQLLEHVVEYKKRYYYDPQKNLEWCKERNLDPLSFGKFLGERKRTFIPSPFGVEHASTAANQGVMLDDKGAWLFLCGRDVFSRAVIGGSPEKGKAIFVYDEYNNLLGYGVWIVHDLSRKNQPAIANKADKGAYVRN